MKTTRTWVGPFLIFLGFAAFYYKALPYFSSATNYITSSITSNLGKSISPSSFCTKDIGEGVCCELHLGAEPCLDECRKGFVDRETFQLTKEYDECADRCLLVYRTTCTAKKRESEPADTQGTQSDSRVRRARRRRQHLVGKSAASAVEE